jgi:hypothetical protein
MDIFNDQVNKKVDAIIIAVSDAKAWEKPSRTPRPRESLFGFDIGAGDTTIWLASG